MIVYLRNGKTAHCFHKTLPKFLSHLWNRRLLTTDVVGKELRTVTCQLKKPALANSKSMELCTLCPTYDSRETPNE